MKIIVDRERHYLTATERKHIPIAYEYCLKHGVRRCHVNRKGYEFDFATNTGSAINYEKSELYPGKIYEVKTPFSFVVP